jgi:peroxiredoxin family protein
MQNKKGFTIIQSRLIWVIFLFLGILFLFQSKNHPQSVEKYYSQLIYPFLTNYILHPFNYIPFSLGDIFYLLVIGFSLFYIIKIIKTGFFKKKTWAAVQQLLGLVLVLEIGVLVFYLFWGLNYFREDAFERLKLSQVEYTDAEFIKLSSMLVDSLNKSRAALKTEDLKQTEQRMFDVSEEAMKKMGMANPKVKSSLSGILLSYNSTSGYYNPFTGEAQVNTHMPFFLKPFIACHELAHQNGVGAENEASFFGFIAGIKSNDRLLKYSSYYWGTREFLYSTWEIDSLVYKDLRNRLSPNVLNDYKTENEYWVKYQGPLSKLTNLFYSNFLKANNQPSGLRTYNQMVVLSMAHFKKEGKLTENLKP